MLYTSSNGCVLRAKYKVSRLCNISENIPQAPGSFFQMLSSFISHVYNMTLGGIKGKIISYMALAIQINVALYNAAEVLLIPRMIQRHP